MVQNYFFLRTNKPYFFSVSLLWVCILLWVYAFAWESVEPFATPIAIILYTLLHHHVDVFWVKCVRTHDTSKTVRRKLFDVFQENGTILKLQTLRSRIAIIILNKILIPRSFPYYFETHKHK